jgi:hypothetical protein
VRKSFRKTLRSFKKGIPTWANYKKERNGFLKKNVKAVFIRKREQSQFFFIKEGSCSPEEVKFQWNEENLHYIRFSTVEG